MALLPPIPAESLLVTTEPDPRSGVQRPTGYISEEFRNWFFTLTGRMESNPERSIALPLEGQSASIATTALPMPSSDGGLFRISVYARITTPGSVSSSLTVTLGWTTNGVSCTKASAAATGNTTSTTIPDLSVIVRRDQATAFTYATTYASAGGTAMQYSLDIVVEAIPA